MSTPWRLRALPYATVCTSPFLWRAWTNASQHQRRIRASARYCAMLGLTALHGCTPGALKTKWNTRPGHG
eukprot:1478952-Lingulodinium_polyedra.AAC.1